MSLSFHAFYMSHPFDHRNNICEECHFGGCSLCSSVPPTPLSLTPLTCEYSLGLSAMYAHALVRDVMFHTHQKKYK
jgi:hypothetical protein